MARLGVKPRLCRSFWRAFASIYSVMLPSTCFREALLACPSFPLWNLPSFTVESTLSSPCSRSDPHYSRQGAALAHLDSLPPHDLVLWTQTALFLLARAAQGYLVLDIPGAAPVFLPTALSVALKPLFPFRQAQYVQVFPLKPAPFCTLFAGLGSTNKSAIFLLFSYYLTLVLFSPPCPLLHLFFRLKLCGRSGRNCLLSPPVLSGYNGSPGTRFFPGNDAADELARRGALLAFSPIPCSLSPLISRIHSRLISDWRRTVSLKFFDTQVPSISTEELVLPRHARCVVSRLRCNGHSLLLGSYLSRIGRIKNPSCSACGHSPQDTFHLVLDCPATDSLRRSLFGDSLSLFDLWSRPWGVARLLGLHGLPPCSHPSERVG